VLVTHLLAVAKNLIRKNKGPLASRKKKKRNIMTTDVRLEHTTLALGGPRATIAPAGLYATVDVEVFVKIEYYLSNSYKFSRNSS
jgi:hypothetical protein